MGTGEKRGLVGSLLRDRSLPVEQQILLLDKLIKAQAEKKNSGRQ
jgi:hypothetical protein